MHHTVPQCLFIRHCSAVIIPHLLTWASQNIENCYISPPHIQNTHPEAIIMISVSIICCICGFKKETYLYLRYYHRLHITSRCISFLGLDIITPYLPRLWDSACQCSSLLSFPAEAQGDHVWLPAVITHLLSLCSLSAAV